MSLDDLTQDLSNSLAEARLVPGPAASLIPQGFAPSVKLDVSFDGKKVNLGNFFRASEVKIAPSVTFRVEDSTLANASYLLLLVDPDAPTPDDPKFAFWRHWVHGGLQPLNNAEHTVAETKAALTAYLGPGPKDDSGPHRYLFLLFQQPHDLLLSKEDVGGEEFVQRRSFDAATFVEKHKLRLVGVNWMRGVGDGWKE